MKKNIQSLSAEAITAWIKEFAFLLVVLMSEKNSDLDLKEAIFLTLLGLSPFRMVSLVVEACFT